jgi:ABC-type uncharacterized transport system YnjBCD permease subunit
MLKSDINKTSQTSYSQKLYKINSVILFRGLLNIFLFGCDGHINCYFPTLMEATLELHRLFGHFLLFHVSTD